MLQCSGPDIPFTITVKYEGGVFVPGIEGEREKREGGGKVYIHYMYYNNSFVHVFVDVRSELFVHVHMLY